MEDIEESIKGLKNPDNINSKKETIENQDNKNKFLGVKRKLYVNLTSQKQNNNKNKNKLSITRSITYYIDKSNFQNDNICLICLDTIPFQERHFLHCGHNFHCNCINKWISMRKDKCPICRKNIKCIIRIVEGSILNLEENVNNNSNNINRNNINNNNNRDNNNNLNRNHYNNSNRNYYNNIDWLISLNMGLTSLFKYLLDFEILLIIFFYLYFNWRYIDKGSLIWILIIAMLLIFDIFANY